MSKKAPLSKTMELKFKEHGLKFQTKGTRRRVVNAEGNFVGDANMDPGHLRWLARNGIWEPLGDVDEPGTTCYYGKATAGPHKGKWIGWSHRGGVPFGIGDMLFDPYLLSDESDEWWSEQPFNKIGTKPIRTDKQAMEAAIRVAKYLDR